MTSKLPVSIDASDHERLLILTDTSAASSIQSVEQRLAQALQNRLRHSTFDDLLKTRSLASAEAQFRDDYSGRFLIELLQNARDAWLKRFPERRDGVVVIHRTAAAITVANQGAELSPEILLGSLTQTGASTKPKGEAIGHKGIGFKSILEISATPQVFSCPGSDGQFQMSVRFDRREAAAAIERCVEHDHGAGTWLSWIAQLQDNNPPDHVPTLAFPLPIQMIERERIQSELRDALSSFGFFNTVIRLPIDSALAQERVGQAVKQIDAAMLVLLGCFRTVAILDEVEPAHSQTWHIHDRGTQDGARHIAIDCGAESDHWLLYERMTTDAEDLAAHVAVGVRMRDTGGVLIPVPAANVFHVFFPTEIRSHLPFLLHAYFSVDASRRHFAQAETDRNRQLLATLETLCVEVVRDLVRRHDPVGCDASGLARLFADCRGLPESPLAMNFRAQLLARLQDERWIPALGKDPWATPRQALAGGQGCSVHGAIAAALPAEDLARAGLALARDQDSDVLAFLQADLASPTLDAKRLASLVWAGAVGTSEHAFLALLEVLGTWPVKDQDDFAAAVGKEEGPAFVPIVDDAGGKPLAALPPRIVRPGQRTPIRLFYRKSRAGEVPGPDDVDETIGVPDCLRFAFLPRTVGQDVRHHPVLSTLGISEFRVNDVLDRLAGPLDGELSDEDHRAVARFVWQLANATNQFAAGRDLGTPGRFFWRAPVDSQSERERRATWARRKTIAQVHLPARDGTTHPAGTLAFGRDWCWDVASIDSALAALESLAQDHGKLLADLDAVSVYLGTDVPADLSDVRAFARWLGVWETLPIEATARAEYRESEPRAPWLDEPGRSAFWSAIVERVGNPQAWAGEDARLAWPLPDQPGQLDAVAGLVDASRAFLEQNSALMVHWRHRTEHRRAEPDSAWFVEELRRISWVPVYRAGVQESLSPPIDSWVVEDDFDPARLPRLPFAFLPVVKTPFRDVASRFGAKRIDTVDAATLENLLRRLRDEFESRTLRPDPHQNPSARQAFRALHQQLCKRLAQVPNGESVLARVGVLADDAGDLRYREVVDVVHDDGEHSTFKRHLAGKLAFAVLARDLSQEQAAALGIRTFRVVSELEHAEGASENVTSELRPMLDDLTCQVLAMLVYSPGRGKPIDVASKEFQERARRMRQLRVWRVEDLVVRLRVEGVDVEHVIGQGRQGDIFLEGHTTAQPQLFHDFPATAEVSSWLPKLGPHLALLSGAPALADTVTLLLQCQSQSERSEFLVERAISDADVERIRVEVKRIVDAELEADERRWWGAVLAVFELAVNEPRRHEDVRRSLLALPAESLRSVLLQALDSGATASDSVLRLALRDWAPAIDAALRARGDVRGFQPLAPVETAPAPEGAGEVDRKPVARVAQPDDVRKSMNRKGLWSKISDIRHSETAAFGAVVLAPSPSPLEPGVRRTASDGRVNVPIVKVRPDAERLALAGEAGERTVLAHVLDPLVRLAEEDTAAFADAVHLIVNGLVAWFQGPAVDAVRAHADKLLAGIADPDERLDELTGLVHLSATSDGFGCDVVGLVTLDGPARPVMMEVKSIQSGRPSRRCMVSRWEWETAKRLGRDFALVTVARDRVEVLLDPTHLADLTATPDGYLVEYRASAKPTTESSEHEIVVVTVT